MTEFRECQLRDIVCFGNGKARPKAEGNIPVYGGNGILGYADQFNYDGETIIIGRVGAYCGSVFYENRPIWISDNALAAKPKGSNSTKYLYYLLKLSDLNQHAEGSSHPLITQTLLNSVEVMYCEDVIIQKAIAEVLSSLDDKIDLLTRQNKTLEDLAQTYFRKWFLEDNVNDPIVVSEIARLENNGINPSRQPLEPFYHYSIPAFDNAQTPVVELGKTILSNKFIVQPNSILVSKLNPVTPRIWRIDENVMPNSVCSTEFQVLKPYDIKHYLFLYFLMKSNDVVSSFAMSATGTSGSHQRIRPEYILEVETPEPDNDKLILFNEICTPMMERVKKNQQQIITLQKLRDTLLPKLISGEVRVKQ